MNGTETRPVPTDAEWLSHACTVMVTTCGLLRARGHDQAAAELRAAYTSVMKIARPEILAERAEERRAA